MESGGVGLEQMLEMLIGVQPDVLAPLTRMIGSRNFSPLKICMTAKDNPGLFREMRRMTQTLPPMSLALLQEAETSMIGVKTLFVCGVLSVLNNYTGGNDMKLEAFITRLATGRDSDGFQEGQDQVIREVFKQFPKIDNPLIQILTQSLENQRTVDAENNALGVITDLFTVDQDDDVLRCATCNDPGKRRCSNCKQVSYCDARCQKLHWDTHRKLCGNTAAPRVKSKPKSKRSNIRDFVSKLSTRNLIDASGDLPKELDILSCIVRLILPPHVLEAEALENHERLSFFEHLGSFKERLAYTGASEENIETVNEDPSLMVYWRVAGSTAEGIGCPQYRWRSDGAREYKGDIDTMIIENLEGIYDIEKIENCDNYCRLKDRLQGYVRTDEYDQQLLDDDIKRAGPTFQMEKRHDCIEMVRSVAFTYWPDVASEWITRTRGSGWPSTDLINEVTETGFCVVPIGRKDSPDQLLEWRMSFSMGEVLLGQSLTKDQRYAYIITKLIQTHFKHYNWPTIPTYFLKTLLFWVCERVPKEYWKLSHIAENVKHFLSELIFCYQKRHLPHYFIQTTNLLQNVTPVEAKEITKNIRHVRDNLVHYLIDHDTKFNFPALNSPKAFSQHIPDELIKQPYDAIQWGAMCQEYTENMLPVCVYAVMYNLQEFKIPLSKEELSLDHAKAALGLYISVSAAADMADEFHNSHDMRQCVELILKMTVKLLQENEFNTFIIALGVSTLRAKLKARNSKVDLSTKLLEATRDYINNAVEDDNWLQVRVEGLLQMIQSFTPKIEAQKDTLENLAKEMSLYAFTCVEDDELFRRINEKSSAKLWGIIESLL